MDNLLLDNLTVLTFNCPSDIKADILRLDQLHPVISGNKWFKLKGHLQQASAFHPVITFGGAWSNHLVATACATQQNGIPSIGIVRGEKPPTLSATLTAAAAYGMQLEFISRREYAAKDEPAFLGRLTERYPERIYHSGRGGGMTGIIGSEDILRVADTSGYTHILCAVGYGHDVPGPRTRSLARTNGHWRPRPERHRRARCNRPFLYPFCGPTDPLLHPSRLPLRGLCPTSPGIDRFYE